MIIMKMTISGRASCVAKLSVAAGRNGVSRLQEHATIVVTTTPATIAMLNN